MRSGDEPDRQGREAREVTIRDQAIRLGQLLKLADLVDQGSDVRPLLATGAVRVNGVPEERRGRQLVEGDLVEVGETAVRVARISERPPGPPRR